MNVEAIETAIKAVVADCSGVTDVRWQTEQSAWRNGITINLKRSPLARVGRDERRRVVADGASVTWPATQVGQRVLRVTVRAESDRTTPLTGMDALARLGIAIYRPSTLATLRAAGLALSSVSGVTDYEASVRERALACAACELVFNVADTLADGNDEWFERVSARVDLSTPDSTTEVTIP